MKNLRRDRNDRKPWNTVSKRVSGKRIGAKGILQEVRYKKKYVKLTGIDLTPMYEDRINDDCKKNNAEENEIREQLEANREAQFNIRKKKIAMLAEQYKNDPVRLALLNKVAKDLKSLEK